MSIRSLVSVFLSAHLTMTGAAVAQEPGEFRRPATSQEMEKHNCDDSSHSFRIVSVNPKNEKPFELLTCPFQQVSFADCDKIYTLAYGISERVYKLQKSPRTQAQKDGDIAADKYLGPSYAEYCDLVSS